MAPHDAISVGLPLIRNERAEVREFLPEFVAEITEAGLPVLLEEGYGTRMGLPADAYRTSDPSPHMVTRERAFAAPIVLTLRPSADALALLRPGSTFLSMLHFRTRTERARRYKERGIEAIALDLIVDDEGDRLVQDMKTVAWNGLNAAFQVLRDVDPGLFEPGSTPIRVTLLGAGRVGRHAVEASTKLGALERAAAVPPGFAGVEVVAIGRNLSCNANYMRRRLAVTNLLVDATSRDDPATPIVPHDWLGYLRPTAVICDLAVDRPLADDHSPLVAGIEGIPSGDLEGFVFPPSHAAWSDLASDRAQHRRWVVSCYSWPGLNPIASMRRYGAQIAPLIVELARRGGAAFLRPEGGRLERALYRGSLEAWKEHL